MSSTSSAKEHLHTPAAAKKGFSKYIKLFGHIGALLTVSAWGTSFICTKVLMVDGGYSPVEMYVYRFIAAYLILLLLTFKKIFSNSWRDELSLLMCGVCSGPIYFVTENFALENTTAGNVSLLSAVSPIFTTILMAIIFRNKIKFGVALGSIMAFIGVGCIIFSHGEGIEIHPLGDLLALSAAMSWAVYTIIVKRLIPIYSSLFITRKLFFYGVITSLPILFMQHGPIQLGPIFDMSQPKFLLNFLFLVVFCSAVAYILWNEAMKILGPVMANNYIYFQPLVTMIVAAITLNERISFIGYVGCFLIIVGLIVADKLKSSIRFIRK